MNAALNLRVPYAMELVNIKKTCSGIEGMQKKYSFAALSFKDYRDDKPFYALWMKRRLRNSHLQLNRFYI